MVCTAEILPVRVSHRLRLPSVSPMMTKWPHAAMAVATPSEELDMSPHDGRFGFVSVTCIPRTSGVTCGACTGLPGKKQVIEDACSSDNIQTANSFCPWQAGAQDFDSVPEALVACQSSQAMSFRRNGSYRAP